MNKYVIASGGSGSMCVRSLIFSLASRYLNPEVELDGKLYIRLVDMDQTSDAKKECEDLIESYNKLRACVNRGTDGGMKLPEIVLEAWDFTEAVRRSARRNGVQLDDKKPITLRELFQKAGEPLDQHTALLMKTFFNDNELNEQLDKGFYGHPNIGAMVFNYVRDDFLRTMLEVDGKEQPSVFMKALLADMGNAKEDEKVPLYLYGSLFGGTGASVIPNLIDVLQSIPDPAGAVAAGEIPQPWGVTRLRIGATMLMPYFNLPAPSGEEAQYALRPSSEKFDAQTKEALQYYDEFKIVSKLDSLLLLGVTEDARGVTSEVYARGGKQYQHFHVILLAAGIAGMRFLCDNSLGRGLLHWRLDFTPDRNGVPGGYRTLVLSEMGMAAEEVDLQTMFRFSLVVSQYMQSHFLADDIGKEALNKRMNMMPEVVQTCRAECGEAANPHSEGVIHRVWTAGLEDSFLEASYKEPVRKAAQFCNAFIQFFFDCALSGYDWTQFHDHAADSVLNIKSDDRYAGMGKRFVDLVDLIRADRCIDGGMSEDQKKAENETLENYFCFDCLANERRVAVTFDSKTTAQLYDDNVKKVLRNSKDYSTSFAQIFIACYNASCAKQAPVQANKGGK